MMNDLKKRNTGWMGAAGAVSKVLALGIALGAITVRADDTLQARIDELDQKIRVIERLNEIAQEEAKAAAAKQGKVNASAGNLGVASADGAFSLRFSGFTQVAGRRFVTAPASPENQSHSFGLRRVQTDIRGTAYKNFGWRLHTNFAGNAVGLLDVHLDWNISPAFSLSAGKFKPPTGLERLLSSPRAPFIEGSFVTALQPNRDLGVQASGVFGDGLLQYQAGIFNGANDNQDNSSEVDGKKDFHARLFAHPFKNSSEELKGFGIGASASYGTRTNGTFTAIPTPGRQTFSPYVGADTLDGTLFRISPQAYYYYGPIGVIAEYTQTTQAVRNGANEADLTNRAWALNGSWVLTGEKNDYRRGPKVAKPNNWPTGGDFGAIELRTRLHGIHFDADIPGPFGPTAGVESALSVGTAVAWHLNDVFKVFASHDYTEFTNVARSDRKPENVLSFSFNAAF